MSSAIKGLCVVLLISMLMATAEGNKYWNQHDCYEGFCWAGCRISSPEDKWCYTTHGATGSREYIKCTKFSECPFNLNCAGECGRRSVIIPLRYIIFIMLCLASIISFVSRGNISILILAMSNPIHNSTVELPNYGHRYDWSAFDQSTIIGSYFWGHILVTFVSGIFAEKYGPRKIAGFGFIIGAILSAMIPISANYLWLLVTGTIAPCIQAVIANWAPPDEMGKFQSVYMSNGFGVVTDWCMSGFIIEHFGWAYAFYAYALILGLFSIAWVSFVYDSPNNHPSISATEKEYILSKLNIKNTKSKPWPQFLSIFLSIPVWALVFFHFGILYPTFMLLTSSPKYFSDVHHLNITTIGILSSIPHLFRFPFSIFFGAFADYLKKKTTIGTALNELSSEITAHFTPAALLIGLIFCRSQPYVSVALMTLSMGFGSAVSITSLQNPLDLSPNFSTTLFSLIHTVALTSGVIAPLVTAGLTEARSTDEEWNYIFLVGAGVSIATAVIFIVLGSTEVQTWDVVEEVNKAKAVKSRTVDVSENDKLPAKELNPTFIDALNI